LSRKSASTVAVLTHAATAAQPAIDDVPVDAAEAPAPVVEPALRVVPEVEVLADATGVLTAPASSPQFDELVTSARDAHETDTVTEPGTPTSHEPVEDNEVVEVDEHAISANTGDSASPQWRNLATPPARYGTTHASVRFNTTIPISVHTRLLQLDALLANEGHRWVISRNALLAAAIDTVTANPDAYTPEADSGEPRVPLQGRISEQAHQALNRLRYSPQGRRPVGAMVALAVAEKLEH